MWLLPPYWTLTNGGILSPMWLKLNCACNCCLCLVSLLRLANFCWSLSFSPLGCFPHCLTLFSPRHGPFWCPSMSFHDLDRFPMGTLTKNQGEWGMWCQGIHFFVHSLIKTLADDPLWSLSKKHFPHQLLPGITTTLPGPFPLCLGEKRAPLSLCIGYCTTLWGTPRALSNSGV